MQETRGLVLFGDVIRSRKDRVETAAWLRDLVAVLDHSYGEARLADFDFTQGDELQGLLDPGADPTRAILQAALGPGARRVRWVCVWGQVDPGQGPTTQRTGQAFIDARQVLGEARLAHERLVFRTGDPESDSLLAGMAPALVDLLDGLTDHQRVVGAMALLDGLRQAEVAERLEIRRATVSVAFGRARVNSVGRLARAIAKVCASANSTATQAKGAKGA